MNRVLFEKKLINILKWNFSCEKLFQSDTLTPGKFKTYSYCNKRFSCLYFNKDG